MKDTDKYKNIVIGILRVVLQCCGSGSRTGTGSERIRNFLPDPIRNRNKRFGSGFGSLTGSEKTCKKEHYFQAEISWFHMIIHTVFHIYK